MDNPASPAERLFPFVLRSRKLIVGRETLARSKRKLQFILISEDISEGSREEILSDFKAYPIIQKYSADQFQDFFHIRGSKVIGFAKSTLATSIYAELKADRINMPKQEGDEGAGPVD